MMLEDKVAVVYGAGGAIGGAVARAFACEGARVLLAGRLGAPVEAVARDVVSAGGSAEAAQVDALDEQAVDRHLQSVIGKAGRVDVSFNAAGVPDTKILGVPLAELDAAVQPDQSLRAGAGDRGAPAGEGEPTPGAAGRSARAAGGDVVIKTGTR